MPKSNTFVDGNSGFSGGLDSTRGPEDLGLDQYAKGINVRIPDIGNDIQTRNGIHCQRLFFKDHIDEDYFYNGNIQGEGWYYDGYRIVLLVCISGCIFQLTEITDGFKVKSLNRGDINNPNRTKCWITRVPYGAIVNDGEAYPLHIFEGKATRINSAYSIRVGRMSAYVQNRFFYVDVDGREIVASDYKNPLSIKNAYNTNIFGFPSPEDEDEITAIGRMKSVNNDSKGGSLAFATYNNLYSCDVRGDRQNWGFNGVGVVEQSLPDFGAVSSFSFEPHNTNLWFRNRDLGIVSLRSGLGQFVNNDTVLTPSADVLNWLDLDQEEFLEFVYTKSYRNRLFTTVGASLNERGFVYFNGLISLKPNQLIIPLDIAPRRFESLITGVRPMALTSIRHKDHGSSLFIWSYDSDGINRLYKIDDDSHYDINKDFKKVEIESSIETRAFVGVKLSDIDLKKLTHVQIALANLGNNADIVVSYRDKPSDNWKKTDRKQIRVKRDPGSFSTKNTSDASFVLRSDQSREFFTRQFKIDSKGQIGIDSLRIIMELANVDYESNLSQYQSFSVNRPNDFYYDINKASLNLDNFLK